ncbi:MAG: DUF3887 domain-containing protein [Chloroflexi bacterium]|nr:DUF3887 domain-containing protein [Chloroflexota bacterium]
MSNTRYVSIASLLILLSFLAAGCGPASPAAISDDEVIAVTTNILTAMDAGDYTAFTSDFSDEMLAAFTEEQFSQLRDLIFSASGNFVSANELSISNKQGFAIYRIICKYDLEDVVVTIVFKIDGIQVEGLFFDSPNLRSASQ